MRSGWWPPRKPGQGLLSFHLPASTQLLTHFKLVPFLLPPPLNIYHYTQLLIYFFKLPIILISLAKTQFSQHFQQAERMLGARHTWTRERAGSREGLRENSHAHGAHGSRLHGAINSAAMNIGVHVSFNSGFLSVYGQHWDC